MPHTNTAPGGHCPTVSAWIIRTDLGPEPKVLVHLHRKYGRLMQPGGHVERDEDPWTAIAHELAEEAGYDVAELDVLQPFAPQPALHAACVITPTPLLQDTHVVEPDVPLYHWDSVFAFVAHGEPTLERAAGESDDLRWLTIAELAAAQEAIPDAQHTGALAVSVLDSWQRVPASRFPTDVAQRAYARTMENTDKPKVDVTYNDAETRYEARIDGELAGFADTRRRGDAIEIPHTEVDPAFGGKGVGGALVKGALDAIRADGDTVVPTCPFVASWIDKHPDYADLLAN